MVQRRAELKLSQRDLAKGCGLDAGTVASIESGKVVNAPRIDTLRALAKGLRVPAEDLIAIAGGQDPKKPEPSRITDEEYEAIAQPFRELSPEMRREAIAYLRYLKQRDEDQGKK